MLGLQAKEQVTWNSSSASTSTMRPSRTASGLASCNTSLPAWHGRSSLPTPIPSGTHGCWTAMVTRWASIASSPLSLQHSWSFEEGRVRRARRIRSMPESSRASLVLTIALGVVARSVAQDSAAGRSLPHGDRGSIPPQHHGPPRSSNGRTPLRSRWECGFKSRTRRLIFSLQELSQQRYNARVCSA